MKQTILFTLVMLFASHFLFAQESKKRPLTDFPIVSTTFNYYPKAKLKDAPSTQHQIMESRTAFQVGFPIVKNKLYALPGFAFHSFWHKDFVNDSEIGKKDFRAYVFNMGLVGVLPNKWKVIPYFTGRYGSDYEVKDQHKDFFYAASILANRKHSDDLLYGFGVYHRSGFSRSSWLPMVQIAYRYGNWMTDVFIPNYIAQYYEISDDTRVGVKATFNSSIFNVNNVVPTSYSYTTTTIGGHFRQRLQNKIFFTAEAGYNYNPFNELRNTTGTIKTTTSEINNDLFFSFGLMLVN